MTERDRGAVAATAAGDGTAGADEGAAMTGLRLLDAHLDAIARDHAASGALLCRLLSRDGADAESEIARLRDGLSTLSQHHDLLGQYLATLRALAAALLAPTNGAGSGAMARDAALDGMSAFYHTEAQRELHDRVLGLAAPREHPPRAPKIELFGE